MEIQSTLENCAGELTSKRRDGNSTRLIDNAIQILFSGKTVVVQDHCQWGESQDANERLFDKVLQRILNEHTYLIHDSRLNINKQDCTLSLFKP